MSDEAVTNLVKRTAQHVPSLTQMKAETLCETNPIADWADHCLIHRLGERTQVGIAKRDKGSESQNTYSFVIPGFTQATASTAPLPAVSQ
jgi:putative DNA primase/helicase